MKEIDILIKNGLIFDGTGSVPYEGDMGICGDRIEFINQSPEDGREKVEYGAKAGRIIDAQGMAVSPGFIDTHAHSEFTLLADPSAEGKVWQGITTEINGNCGLSAAPLYGEAFDHREGDLKEYGIPERWSSLSEYLAILYQRKPALNFVTLAGHGNIRASVLGYKNKKPDLKEMEEMQKLLRESVSEGAIGLSTGLIYPPGIYSTTEELVDLLGPLSGLPHPRRYIYTSHMRSEGEGLVESVEEVLRIGSETGLKVHISHIKTSGQKNWNKIDAVLALIEEAKGNGIPVTCDRYPYTASSTDLDTVIPSWAYEGGSEAELRRLKSREISEKIRQEILGAHPEKKYWEEIRVSSVVTGRNSWMEGKTIAHIAAEKKQDPVDMLLLLLIEEELRVGAIFSSMSEDNLMKFLSLPYAMVGTDSSARSFSGPTATGKPHPRGFGSFPRYLGRYVRDGGLMDLNEAIHRITLLPATTFGMRDRGILKEGSFADIVVFDHGKIIDGATYDDPFLKSEGIYYTLINGEPAIWEGRLTNRRAGRILRQTGNR
jgi:N-acyl-D-amino-acid deacylase